MAEFDREELKAAVEAGKIPVSDDNIRRLDGLLRVLAQQYRARKVAREQDLNGQLTRLEETRSFRAIHKVVWTSNKPHGVGSTRTVSLSTATIYEHFFRWEQDRRCSFCITGASMPLAHALAEDYLLEEFAPGKTRFTYRVAIEPRLVVAMGGPISRMYFGSMFKSACKNLQSYVLKART